MKAIKSLFKPLLHALLPEGFYMRLQAAAMAREIAAGGHTEKEMHLLASLIRPGETALDIGSNYAMVAYHLSKAVGPAGKVFAFEPIPFPFEASLQIAERLGLTNVEFQRLACGDANGKATFRVPLQAGGAPSAGQSHLSARDNDMPGKDRHFRFERWSDVECDIVRLDDHLRGLSGLSFIKADIEGAELLAFRGASGLIDAHKPSVLCEYNRFFLRGFRIDSRDLFDFFRTRDYIVFWLPAPDAALEEFSEDKSDETNVIFVHRSRLDRLPGPGPGA